MRHCSISCLLLAAIAAGCQPSTPTEQVVTFQGLTMGTSFTVKLVEPVDALSPDWLSLIEQRLIEVNEMMSTYDPESELSKFNSSDSSDWFEVSKETAAVVAYSLELSAMSDGAFDPTVGPLVNLWGFGPEDSVYEPPADTDIEEAKQRVGYSKIETRTDKPALRKSDSQVYLDLSAVAKGYGVDAVAELLTSHGVESYMVEIGGEVRTAGSKPNNQSWRIQVLSPSTEKPDSKSIIAMRDQALATSGDYYNFFVHEGRRYSHTISPSTGKPVDHNLAAVSVLAPTCREADGLATTLLVMGPEVGYDWAEKHRVAALFGVRHDDDTYQQLSTTAWSQAVNQNEEAQ